MENVAVYVPAADRFGIADRSGIVGTHWPIASVTDDDPLVIDYEGNLYGAANMKTFADRVYHAWGRHSARYPTVARLRVEPESMIKVAEFWIADGQVCPLLAKLPLLHTWLGVDAIDGKELRVSHGT